MMNLIETIAYIQSQLQHIELQQEENRRDQAETSLRIEELEAEVKQQYKRQSELDSEAIELYTKAEEFNTKLERLTRISSLSQEFEQLQKECKDNQELLETLYVSIFESAERNKYLRISIQDLASSEDNQISEKKSSLNISDTLTPEVTIEHIREVLPDAEQIHQQLSEWYSEKFEVYNHCLIDNMTVAWYSVAFIAFGRSLYYRLSRKHHPDMDGSDGAMQMINAAWEVSEDYSSSMAERST
jgi:predicted ATP-dependent protease